MPDGGTETLPGHNDYVLNLVGRALHGDRTTKWIFVAQSVSSTEPGGADMIDLGAGASEWASGGHQARGAPRA